jgi:transposase-like protein
MIVTQHFLLSAKARTLSLAKVMRLSDAEAYETFKAVRWAANDGNAYCPRCGCAECYEYSARRVFKCKGCERQFSVTTDTIFASRKMAHRDILAAIALFVNGAKGLSALQLSRDLDCQYKTAFVLLHKLREAMGAEQRNATVRGEVEIDGAFFGGYIKPENRKEDRKDRRLKVNQNGKRHAVVIMRERGGRAVPFVAEDEGDAVSTIIDRVEAGSTVYADEAGCWDIFHSRFETKRINHSVAYRDKDACTNQAESYFSRLRRMEVGTHHHVSGRYLHQYATEAAWREDHRREPNGTQYQRVVSAALAHSVSREWKGYWQRGAA